MGVKYYNANGGEIPNGGEITLTHRDEPQGDFDFTFQNAKVHCPIVSVKELVIKGCEVSFHDRGEHISYPDGRRIRFVRKQGVFFVQLKVLPPGTRNMLGEKVVPDFHRQGP